MRYYILACLYVHFTSALSFFSFLTFSFCLRIWKDDIKNEKFVIVTRYLLLLRGGDQTALSRGLMTRGEMLPWLDIRGVDTVLNSSSMTDTVASGW
jgi:hypothetical protein